MVVENMRMMGFPSSKQMSFAPGINWNVRILVGAICDVSRDAYLELTQPETINMRKMKARRTTEKRIRVERGMKIKRSGGENAPRTKCI